MNTNIKRRCIFVGLPDSGKSSFIGALWHVLKSKEVDIELSIVVQPADREYLNDLEDAWLKCKSPGRTTTDLFKEVELDVSIKNNGNTMTFIFPDVSGEMYRSQFENRKLSELYNEQITVTNGLFLFINPDFLIRPVLINDAAWVLNKLVFQSRMNQNNGLVDAKEVSDLIKRDNKSQKGNGAIWQAKMAQTQLVLVDLLQMIASKVLSPCRVCVIVSAWDEIINLPDHDYSALEPQQWVGKELPFLMQYLQANEALFQCNFFGVSAQGGNYSNDIDKLNRFEIQSQRIIVQNKNIRTNDITLPIKWIVNG